MLALVVAVVSCGLSQEPAAPEQPYCFRVETTDPYQCFATEAERGQAIAKLKAADVERKRAEQRDFIKAKAKAEAAAEERQRQDREEWERKEAELGAKQAAEQQRIDGIRVRALDPAVAVPAISALMCDLRGGPNAEWVNYWRDILRERFKGARPLSCAAVQGVLACHRDLASCSDEKDRAAAEAWTFAQPDLKGPGLRADAALLCCDGEDSPTCTCGGSRRGCCSHHGGVCGCSADKR